MKYFVFHLMVGIVVYILSVIKLKREKMINIQSNIELLFYSVLAICGWPCVVLAWVLAGIVTSLDYLGDRLTEFRNWLNK